MRILRFARSVPAALVSATLAVVAMLILAFVIAKEEYLKAYRYFWGCYKPAEKASKEEQEPAHPQLQEGDVIGQAIKLCDGCYWYSFLDVLVQQERMQFVIKDREIRWLPVNTAKAQLLLHEAHQPWSGYQRKVLIESIFEDASPIPPRLAKDAANLHQIAAEKFLENFQNKG